METIKKHFEEEAKEYDGIILRLIPDYSAMIEALVAAIPMDPAQPFSVIDLGCGTGTISHAIKKAFPLASITCLDIAEKMIEIARSKLVAFPETRFQVGDFTEYQFDRTYDLVVSSLALHHLVTDPEKIAFYRQIFAALNPDGAFLNADVVLGSSSRLQAAYLEKWKNFMRKQVSEEEINQTWIPKYDAEDRPARLMDQAAWLSEIGFVEVDVIWKYYNFAVYGGRKPGDR